MVDAILDHPKISAISFVGSTPVAKYIYSRAAANGKRVQCQGGAKNHAIVLPDADDVNGLHQRRRDGARANERDADAVTAQVESQYLRDTP